MQNTWVIVADGSRARIFTTQRHSAPLLEFKALLNPAGRMLEKELVSDSPGRSFDSAGHGRHAMEPKNPIKKHKIMEFARTLAAELEYYRVRGAFKQLILVAPHAYLGELRKHLGTGTASLVSLELAKDFSRLDAQQIRKRLPTTLPAVG